MKFKFKFQMQAEGSYGNKDPTTGQWTGMIKDLRTQQADMAVIDMSITSVRQTAVDFTMPYMNTGQVQDVATAKTRSDQYYHNGNRSQEYGSCTCRLQE